MRNYDDSVGFLVNDVARLLRQNFNRRAQELGLSQAQWRALAYLSRQEGVNQITLADSLEIQPITLARLIDHLQEAGLVDRRLDPEDRRAFRLYLTEKAQPLIDRMVALAAETREDAMAGLSDKEDRAVIRALQRIKKNLLSAENNPAPQSKESVTDAAESV
jgi:MarR family transcriptional regulator for hemolysin